MCQQVYAVTSIRPLHVRRFAVDTARFEGQAGQLKTLCMPAQLGCKCLLAFQALFLPTKLYSTKAETEDLALHDAWLTRVGIGTRASLHATIPHHAIGILAIAWLLHWRCPMPSCGLKP